MAAMSDYLEDALLDHVLEGSAYTQPTSIVVALFTSDAGDLESSTLTHEVSGGNYARTTATFSAASSGTATNSADITFPVASAAWGTMNYCAIMDQGVNVLYHGSLAASKIVNSGDTFKFNADDLSVAHA